MKLCELRYGETLTIQCLERKCNYEFKLTLEPMSLDMTERERYQFPALHIRYCPFCGVQHLDCNYEHGDEPPE